MYADDLLIFFRRLLVDCSICLIDFYGFGIKNDISFNSMKSVCLVSGASSTVIL
jgi:hypothetical protein